MCGAGPQRGGGIRRDEMTWRKILLAWTTWNVRSALRGERGDRDGGIDEIDCGVQDELV